MASNFAHVKKLGLITAAPAFLDSNIQYEVVMGSTAYGVSQDTSDFDVYGYVIPPKDWIFPHLRGDIPGFDPVKEKFEQFQQHHIFDASALGGRGREYDFAMYNITKYFRLLMDNNPNIVDSLFVPRNCVLHSTAVGEMVREQRQVFLHKGCWAKFKGYAYSQMHKIRTKKPEGSRVKIIEEFGYDVKFAYHVVRLLDEVEQILSTHELTLGRNKEQLKAIRRGEWTLEQVEDHFTQKERDLEQVYQQSTLRETPDTQSVKQLLLACLEQHYGSLDAVIVQEGKAEQALREIRNVLDQYP